MSLAAELEKARTEVMKNIGGAIDSITGVAQKLEMKETANRLTTAKKNLQSEKFNVIVLGRFKNGKSTFMNALLGRLTHAVPELSNGKGAMPTNDLPTTATLTSIDYAEKPFVKVWYNNGKSEPWSLEKYLRESTVKDDEEVNEKFFANIRQFEMGLPVELCRSGVTLFDSPGLDDVPMRTAVTMQAVERADAAIVLYRSDVLAGQSEREFVAEHVLDSGTRIFTIINMWNGKQADERFKGFVWNRLVKNAMGGPTYSGQEMQSQDIFPVDALEAEQGKLMGDERRIEESGIAEFERRLGNFLLNDRYYAHLAKHVKTADNDAKSIEQQITQRRAALKQDEQKLQQAYEAIKPQLEAIRKRRDNLPKIFDRYRNESKRELKTAFEQFINQLKQDLPSELAKRKLPTLEKWGSSISVYRQKTLCKEAAEACNVIITERLGSWGKSKDGAQKYLEPVFERLFEEIRDEIAQIDRQLNEIHVQLTGWNPSLNAPGSVISVQERVFSGIAGLFVGDFSAIFGAGGGGWRSVAGNLVGQVAAGFILTALGVTSGIVFFPVMLAAGIFVGLVAGGAGLEKRVKDKALTLVLPELSKAPEQAANAIDLEVDKIFNEMQSNVMTSIFSVIEEEEANIRQMVAQNKLEREEKQKILNLLEESSKQITVQRQVFKQALTTAQQIPAQAKVN